MRPPILLPLLVFLGGMLLPASLSAQTDGPVLVHFHEPMQFTDFKETSFPSERMTRALMVDFARAIRRATLRHLPEGYSIQVTFNDIDLAGQLASEMGASDQDVRVIRDIYPPRLRFVYTVRGPTGEVLAEGEENLSDLNFMASVPHLRRQDPFIYETELFRNWVRKLEI
jgi:hypothetical protein